MSNYKPCSSTNFQLGRSMPIQYIVVHYTANNGDTAAGNASYFANTPGLQASAHYFVDEHTVWQSVPEKDTAWHCGGGLQGSGGHTFYGKCKNSNSIGVELCSRKDSSGIYYFKDETLTNAIALIKDIMARRNIPLEHVIRHYDVTGKVCPAPLIGESAWQAFKKQLTEQEEREMKMIYNYIDENMPEWARPTIQKLVEKGYLKGNEKGELGLDDTMLKIFVVFDRAGGFGV